MSWVSVETSEGDVSCTVPRGGQFLDVLRAAIDIIEGIERRRAVALMGVFGLGQGDE